MPLPVSTTAVTINAKNAYYNRAPNHIDRFSIPLLKRNRKWQQLKADAEAVGEILVPYTFRHRYAKASHQKNDPVIPLANITSHMGHTIPVHLENYARFTPDRTAELYDAE